MQCGNCKNENDADALFCEHCGRDFAGAPETTDKAKGRKLLYIMMAVVVLAVAGVGYYKFFVPSGVAAVVNGEEIMLAEVDGLMQGVANSGSLPPEILSRARYQILNDLITERIAWQEARKAGVRISAREVEEAYDQLAAASGSDRAAFEALVRSQYGGGRAFKRSLERRIAIRQYISSTVSAGVQDPAIAGARVNQWLQDISGRASVRIALVEQLPGANGGCGSGGCGGSGASGCGGSGASGCGSAPKTGKNVSAQGKEARKAALTYWKERYGDDAVEAKVLDFGCHIQVDMIKGTKIAKSLRYQNGEISEL